jgi:NAD(P)-dependent dehydrogenase (short-subunit alcohol dehydrogenase family)
MTAKVAIAAQYASGICTSRAIMTDTVAATAMRTAYLIEGRFFSSQAHNFMRTRFLQRTRFGKIDILVNDAGVY